MEISAAANTPFAMLSATMIRISTRMTPLLPLRR